MSWYLRRRQGKSFVSSTGSGSTEKTRQVESFLRQVPEVLRRQDKSSHSSDRFRKYGEDKTIQVVSLTGYRSTQNTRQVASPKGSGSTEKKPMYLS